jgi:hypothetical protein
VVWRIAVVALALTSATTVGGEVQPQPATEGFEAPAPAPILTASPAPVATPTSAAPTRIGRGAKIFIEQAGFGMVLSAALMKKHVPVVVVTDRDKADFFLQMTSAEMREGTGERVVKVLAYGWWAGSGRSAEASVSIANRDGAIVWARSTKKDSPQKAAEDIANNLEKEANPMLPPLPKR